VLIGAQTTSALFASKLVAKNPFSPSQKTLIFKALAQPTFLVLSAVAEDKARLLRRQLARGDLKVNVLKRTGLGLVAGATVKNREYNRAI